MQKELLAVFKSLEHFKKQILGYKIIVKTDNEKFTKTHERNQGAQRWKIALPTLTFTLTMSEVNKI